MSIQCQMKCQMKCGEWKWKWMIYKYIDIYILSGENECIDVWTLLSYLSNEYWVELWWMCVVWNVLSSCLVMCVSSRVLCCIVSCRVVHKKNKQSKAMPIRPTTTLLLQYCYITTTNYLYYTEDIQTTFLRSKSQVPTEIIVSYRIVSYLYSNIHYSTIRQSLSII